jgi:hypothetical protein
MFWHHHHRSRRVSLILKVARISRQRGVCLAWLALHLLLIISFSCRDTLRVIAEGPTIFPVPFGNFSRKAQRIISIVLGRELPAFNPVREALGAYVHAAGIDVGYGYFAPNVPGGYRLVFELKYSDGRAEYELPSVSSAAAGLRLAGLLDTIGRTPYDPIREILLKTLAQSVWRQHPDVKSVRAILGSVRLPSIREFQQGQRESYEFLYAYDFSLQNDAPKQQDHQTEYQH